MYRNTFIVPCLMLFAFSAACNLSAESKFQIDSEFAPVLASITPASGLAGSVITITGDNFFTQNDDIGIIIGDQEIIPVAVSRTAMVIALPDELPTGQVDVSIRVYNQQSDSISFVILDEPTPVSAVALGVTVTTGPGPVTTNATAKFGIRQELPE